MYIAKPIRPVRLLLGSVLLSLAAMSNSASAQDLVIESWERLTDEPLDRGGCVQPVRVTVLNTGDEPAGPFKLSAHYAGSRGEFVVAFSTGTDLWYPRVTDGLSPGESEPFFGELVFNPGANGETVQVWTVADSCAGDEFMPAYCRVEESDETNNTSRSIEVSC